MPTLKNMVDMNRLDPTRRSDRPGWLPDWRRSAEYAVKDPFSSELVEPAHWSFTQWAWTFVRRNPDYWADWKRFDALPDSVLAEDGVSVLSAKWESTFANDESMEFFHDDPPSLPGETVDRYFRRTGVDPQPLRWYLEEKWGFFPLQNPSCAAPSISVHSRLEAPPRYLSAESISMFLLRRWRSITGREMTSDELERLEAMGEFVYLASDIAGQYEQVVAFDLSYPLKPQLENVELVIGDEERSRDEERKHEEEMRRAQPENVQEVFGDRQAKNRAPYVKDWKYMFECLLCYDGAWSRNSPGDIVSHFVKANSTPYRRTENGRHKTIQIDDKDKVCDRIATASRFIASEHQRLLQRATWGLGIPEKKN